MIDRIRERDSFVRLRRQGVRVRIDPLWCSSVLDPNVYPPRVAFAIGRAVGSAVTRNRLRRQLRALLARFDVPPGLYLIGVTPRACELTFDELESVLAKLLSSSAHRAARST
ncbi:MAG: ribonuclease P protein component [Ilumatobacteraceae bacterium]|nr:ribonuclease P protein component [Ilumatobacteraceae bacterium]